MKFMMNGALTVGTLDGANVEMHEELGDGNIFLFGLHADEVARLKALGLRAPAALRARRRAHAWSGSAHAGFSDGVSYDDLAQRLLQRDEYMLLQDFASYCAAEQRMAKTYADRAAWDRMSLLNIARSGIFAADRAVAQYADNIWHVRTSKQSGGKETAPSLFRAIDRHDIISLTENHENRGKRYGIHTGRALRQPWPAAGNDARIGKEKTSNGPPVQAGCIPPMREWKDVIAKAPTGTGKTFAFGIPIIEHIDPESEEVQAVIMAPTRELAMQITAELRDLAVFYERHPRGVPLRRRAHWQADRRAEEKAADRCGDPGRLSDHMKRRTVRLDRVQTVVLDEADRCSTWASSTT